jgi:integration host factor subunit beta
MRALIARSHADQEAPMSTVTKKELIERIAEQSGLKRQDVRRVVQGFLDEIINELGKGNRLEFRDFGVFDVRERAGREAQHDVRGAIAFLRGQGASQVALVGASFGGTASLVAASDTPVQCPALPQTSARVKRRQEQHTVRV